MPKRPHPFPDTETEGERLSEAICKRCQQMFSDDFIYENQELQNLIEEDPKGYVSIKKILQDPTISSILQPTNLREDQCVPFIKKVIEDRSKFLKANTVAIRRKIPFVNCEKEMKFFYVDGFKEGTTKSELLKMLGLDGEVKKVEIRKKHIPYARVYYPNHREIEQKSLIWKDKYQFEVQTYASHTSNLAVFDNIRAQELNPNAQKLTENFWLENTNDKMEVENEEHEEPQQIYGEFEQDEEFIELMRNGKIRAGNFQKFERHKLQANKEKNSSFNNDVLF